MDSIPMSRVLEFRPDQLNYVRKQYNLDKPEDMRRAIDVLEAWVKMQKHFTKKELPRNYLEKTILAGKGSVERAKERLDKMCTFRTMMPNFFGENLTKNSFDYFHVFRSLLLPKPTNENYRVYMLKAVGSSFNFTLLMNCYLYIIMICEYIMAYDYSDGVVIIIDHSEVNYMELIKSLTLTEIRQLFTIMTEGFGMRIKGIHVLTPSKLVDTFVALLKPLISPKLGKRVCIHKDTSTLYEYVPKNVLPVEYGGTEKPFIEIHDKLKDDITGKEFMKYLEEINEAKTDESLRDTGKFNEQYLGTPGSFRILSVD